MVSVLALGPAILGGCTKSSETDPAPDGGVPDAPSTGPVACHWQRPEPIVVTDLSAPGSPAAKFDSHLAIHAAGRSHARVVATHGGNDTTTQLFTIHTGEGTASSADLPRKLLNTAPVTGGVGVMVAEADGSMGLYRIPDEPVEPAFSSPTALSTATGAQPFEAAFSELTPGNVFFVASFERAGGSAVSYDYLGGSAGSAPGFQGLFDNNPSGRLGPVFMIPTGADVYTFLGNDPSNPPRIYKLPVGAAPVKSALMKIGGTNGAVTLSGGPSKASPGKIDLLGATVTASIDATMYVGQVDTAQLDNIVIAEPGFKPLQQFAASDVPGNSGTTRFFDDDWAAVGIGVVPRGGLNFAWLSGLGSVIVTMKGENRLLGGRAITGSAIDLEERLGERSASFAVVWKEEVATGGAHDVVYFNELVCAPGS